MQKDYISWNDIQDYSNKVALEIERMSSDLSKATIVAVSRGGLVPAQLIAYKLDIRDIRVLKLISYDENDQRSELKDISTDELIDGENVFIIDDLADSGETVRYLRKHFPKSIVCTLLMKDCCLEKPDIVIKTGIKGDTWIVFPWD